MDDPDADEDLIPADTRRVTRLLDSMIQPDGTLSDSEDEGEGGRRNIASNHDVDTEAPEPTPAPSTSEETKDSTPEVTANDEEMKEAEDETSAGDEKETEPSAPVEGPKETVLKATTAPAATGIMNPGSTGGAGPSASTTAVVHETEAPMEVDEPAKSAEPAPAPAP
jgi:hypothetical protein